MEEFRSNYTERKEPIHFRKCQIHDTENEHGEFATLVTVTYTNNGIEKRFEGVGNGPIDAMQKGLEKELGIIIFNRSGRGVTLTNDGTEFLMYARQIYGQYESVKSGRVTYGVGISSNITRASFRGIFSAVNRLFF